MAKVKRFSKFGVVINPTEKIENIENLNKQEIVDALQIGNFPKAVDLHNRLQKVSVKGDKKRNAKSEEYEFYDSKITDYVGQIEQGEKGTYHWQLYLEVKPKVTKTKLLTALSQALFDQEISSAISVMVAADSNTMKEYCEKDARATLIEPYEVNILDIRYFEYLEFQRENPELKKL